jgi:predicted O-methyltransferase YrrM
MRQCIWDCVIFSGELDMLQMRFEELEDHVDRFVVVEAGMTFQGDVKPLHFREHVGTPRFSRWLSRLSLVERPDLTGDSSWEREASQREALRSVPFAPGDMVLLSDVDEIPSAEAIDSARRWLVDDPAVIVVFDQKFCCFAADLVNPRPWYGTVATLAKNVTSWQALREMTGITKAHVPVFGGFHFSWLGDKVDHLRKLGTFSHTELKAELGPKLAEGYYTRERMHVDGNKLSLQPIDDSYPAFIREKRCPKSWISQRVDNYWAEVWREVDKTEGWLSEPEAKMLFELARDSAHGAVVELGAFRGRSTVALALGLRDGGHTAPNQKLVSVDLWSDHAVGLVYSNRLAQLDIETYKVQKDTSAAASSSPTGHPHDLVFIDGDHSYEGCRRDFEAWSPFIGTGGFVAFHDSWAPGPSQVIRELPGWFEKHAEADSLSVFKKR